MNASDQAQVYSKALAVSLAVYVLNLLIEKRCERLIHDRVLCWAVAFGTVQTGMIVVFSVSLIAWRTYTRFKENLYDQIRPAIRDRVLALAFEGESWSSPAPHNGPARRVLEDNIARTLATVKAAGRERVARFAVDQGFAAQWVEALASKSKNERKRAISLLGLIAPVAGNGALFACLRDRDSAVRAEAYRALLLTGDTLSVEQVFQAVLQESLLMRALLADDLKRHAGYLLAHTIPRVLETAMAPETARCLEILIAWNRAIPSLDVRPWLRNGPDASLSRLLLRLLPYVLTDDSLEDYVRAALRSGNLETRCAAAETAGRLKLTRLIPLLESALGEDRRLGLMSASALAQLGEAGERALEKVVVGPDRKAASVAMEALEHVTVRR